MLDSGFVVLEICGRSAGCAVSKPVNAVRSGQALLGKPLSRGESASALDRFEVAVVGKVEQLITSISESLSRETAGLRCWLFGALDS